MDKILKICVQYGFVLILKIEINVKIFKVRNGFRSYRILFINGNMGKIEELMLIFGFGVFIEVRIIEWGMV